MGGPGLDPARDDDALVAWLGPTNTGKTHRAIERMLEHRTGMIGLPLRLLAREVYDRVLARVGAEQVALVTGEEKRIPARPRFWVCTVESMPVDRTVDFVAVDEIQLAADRQRGHVFTDRLLHLRGRFSTWLLGASTMAPIVRTLLPQAAIRSSERLSALRWAGEYGVARLPPRSAVVGFSTDQVYGLAERLRQRRGGTAVVLGALSPRTRNAQVALYESGAVDHIVATDAIGMGLNMDVDHVAFASLRKFDGREHRELEPDELAQIAGRAGRHERDGAFGVLEPQAPLPTRIWRQIERHEFAPVRQLYWRNPAVDTSSIETLIGSLRVLPPHEALRPVEQADDLDALLALARRPTIRAMAAHPELVGLLWEVCKIPDYRKLLVDSHVELLARVFEQLAGPAGMIDVDWMASRIDRLDDLEGDIDALVTRIAWIRTWTYISSHARWVDDAEHWQGRTRAIEDRLSDALHDRLIARFVRQRDEAPRRARPRGLGLEDLWASFAELDDPARARQGWLAGALAADDDAFELDGHGRIALRGVALAELRPGDRPRAADVRLSPALELAADERRRLEARLRAWLRGRIAAILAPLADPRLARASAAVRGWVYALEAGLGVASLHAPAAGLRPLRPADRDLLARSGVRKRGARLMVATLDDPALVRVRASLLGRAADGPRPGPTPSLREVAVAPCPAGARRARGAADAAPGQDAPGEPDPPRARRGRRRRRRRRDAGAAPAPSLDGHARGGSGVGEPGAGAAVVARGD